MSTVSETNVLKEKALKVKLHRKKLSRNTTDRDLTKILVDMKKVKNSGFLRVNKTLFPKDITDPYMKVISEAGKYFYRCTTPWDDKGYRLLSVKMFKEFSKKMKSFTRDFRAAVETFVGGIEASMLKMEADLGQAFKKDDYAHLFLADGGLNREFLLEKFNLEVEYDKVSDSDTNDLRASLTDEDRAIISDQIEKSHMEKFAKSQQHCGQLLYDAIEAIHERLADTDNVFRDTLIENLEDLCNLIPKMNIAGDKDLNDLAEKALTDLCSFGPQELRDDTVKRAATSKKAEKMLGNMEGII